ncbi:MAG: DUF1330 domain-containing protein [Candidatus Binataceae bacterium]
MSNLTPTPDAIRSLLAAPDDGPVVMLNLLKYKPNGGAESYAEYGRHAVRHIQAAGGRVLYSGRVENVLVGEDSWDAIAVVEYPSRKAFLAMVANPEYHKIHVHRENGLERTVLIATVPTALASGGSR